MVWQYEKVDDDENQYALLWEHHVVVEKLTAKNNYSSVIYMEDDTHLPWSHIESQASDTIELEPLGFTRCIYRTEIGQDGGVKIFDWTVQFCLDKGKFLILEPFLQKCGAYHDEE